MDLNSLVFPIPSPSYNKNSFPRNLLWIPKKDYSYKDKLKYSIKSIHFPPFKSQTEQSIPQEKLKYHYKSQSMIQRIPSISIQFDNKFQEVEKKSQTISYIPCLFIQTLSPSDNLMIFFHSNYEDLGSTFELCNNISKYLNINILSVEYPGYGIYKYTSTITEDLVLEDSRVIFQFVTEILMIKEENIILMGRCIGSGPAVKLASEHKIASLILVSPIKSLKEAVKTMFPKMNIGNMLKNFVKERFNNFEIISKVECPILFIHGKKDSIIPPTHSNEMIKKCTAPSQIVMPENMSHNTFNYSSDICDHINNFIKHFKILSTKNSWELKSLDDLDEDKTSDENLYISFPKIMYKYPYKY